MDEVNRASLGCLDAIDEAVEWFKNVTLAQVEQVLPAQERTATRKKRALIGEHLIGKENESVTIKRHITECYAVDAFQRGQLSNCQIGQFQEFAGRS